MKCPFCCGETRVLETRKKVEMTLTRRRQCDGGCKSFMTYEVISTVFASCKEANVAAIAAAELSAANLKRERDEHRLSTKPAHSPR